MTRRRRRGITERLLTSGALQTFGLDALLVVALGAIGVSVYRLSPDLMGAFIGLILLIVWWSEGKARSVKPGSKAE